MNSPETQRIQDRVGRKRDRAARGYLKQVLAATAGTRFGAMIRCAYGLERDATPRFEGQANVTSDGFLMWGFVDSHGDYHSGAFAGDAESYHANINGLCAHLKLNAAQATDFQRVMRRAIAQDWRMPDTSEHSAQGPDAIARRVKARAAQTSAPGFDPTCALCETGEEPGHEH